MNGERLKQETSFHEEVKYITNISLGMNRISPFRIVSGKRKINITSKKQYEMFKSWIKGYVELVHLNDQEQIQET